jgi:hypothetical protein
MPGMNASSAHLKIYIKWTKLELIPDFILQASSWGSLTTL